jgi:SAM-dependent methyltransferase
MQQELTDRSYWNSLYSPKDPQAGSPGEGHLLTRLFGSRASAYHEVFFENYLWNQLLPRFIPVDPAARVLEIGSGEGHLLIHFHRRFGHIPYGVEYTPSGAAANRWTFAENGIDTRNVIEGDALSPSFAERYAESFDVVMSRGFIEHFTDPSAVIEAHLRLLKPGGTLFVTVPNLRGLNWLQVRMFAPAQLPLHNLSIMKVERFRRLFPAGRLNESFCNLIGGLHLLMGNIGEGVGVQEPLLGILRKAQLAVNIVQCEIGAPNAWWLSPQLVYVGTKT